MFYFPNRGFNAVFAFHGDAGRRNSTCTYTIPLGADADYSLQTEHPHLHLRVNSRRRCFRLLRNPGSSDWSASDFYQQV
jgi:hypothetical protein